MDQKFKEYGMRREVDNRSSRSCRERTGYKSSGFSIPERGSQELSFFDGRGRREMDFRRNFNPSQERSVIGSIKETRDSVSYFHSSKESTSLEEEVPFDSRSSFFEPVLIDGVLQIGGYSYSLKNGPDELLSEFIRLIERVLPHRNTKIVKYFSWSELEKSLFRVYSVAVWFVAECDDFRSRYTWLLLFLRSLGCFLTGYVDDFLLMSPSWWYSIIQNHLVLLILWELGLIVALEKLSFLPRKILDYLGFTINTELNRLLVKKSKRVSLMNYLRSLLNRAKKGKAFKLVYSSENCWKIEKYKSSFSRNEIVPLRVIFFNFRGTSLQSVIEGDNCGSGFCVSVVEGEQRYKNLGTFTILPFNNRRESKGLWGVYSEFGSRVCKLFCLEVRNGTSSYPFIGGLCAVVRDKFSGEMVVSEGNSYFSGQSEFNVCDDKRRVSQKTVQFSDKENLSENSRFGFSFGVYISTKQNYLADLLSIIPKEIFTTGD